MKEVKGRVRVFTLHTCQKELLESSQYTVNALASLTFFFLLLLPCNIGNNFGRYTLLTCNSAGSSKRGGACMLCVCYVCVFVCICVLCVIVIGGMAGSGSDLGSGLGLGSGFGAVFLKVIYSEQL